MVLHDIPGDRLLGHGLALLVQEQEPALDHIGGLDQHVDLVPAIGDADRGELDRSLGSPLGSELLGDLGHDRGGGDVVGVALDLGHVLSVREAVVDPLGQDLQLHLRRHHHAELLVQVGDVDGRVVHRGESEGIDGVQGLGHNLVMVGGHVDPEDLLLGGEGSGLGGGCRLGLARELGNIPLKGLNLGSESGGGLTGLRLDGCVEEIQGIGLSLDVDGLELVQESLAVFVANLLALLVSERDLAVLDGKLALSEQTGDKLAHLGVVEIFLFHCSTMRNG